MELTKQPDISSDSIPTDKDELYYFAKEVGALEKSNYQLLKEVGASVGAGIVWWPVSILFPLMLLEHSNMREKFMEGCREGRRVEISLALLIICAILTVPIGFFVSYSTLAICYFGVGSFFAGIMLWDEIDRPSDFSRLELIKVLQKHYKEQLEDRRSQIIGEDASLTTHINRTEEKIAEISSAIEKLQAGIEEREWEEAWMKEDLVNQLEEKEREKHKLQHTLAFLQLVRRQTLERIQQAESQLAPLSSTFDDLEAYQELMEESRSAGEDAEKVAEEAIEIAWKEAMPVLVEVSRINLATVQLNALGASEQQKQISQNTSAETVEFNGELEDELQRNAEDFQRVAGRVTA